MAFAPTWLQQQPADFLGAMRAGAGLGLQIRQQAAEERARAAAQALQERSLFQQTLDRQAEREAQIQEAGIRQQNALAQLQAQQGYHFDTLAEQARDNERQTALALLAERRQQSIEERDAKNAERLAQNDAALLGFRERELKLAEDKVKNPTSAGERVKSAAQKYAIDQYRSVFGEPDPVTLSELENSVASSQWKQPVAEEMKRIRSGRYLADRATEVADDIDAFNKRFGKGKDVFSKKYTGLLNYSLDELRRKASANITDPEAIAAYSIAQRFQNAFNQEALRLSGAAVSQSEAERMQKAIGSMKSGNFANEVRNFAEMEARQFVDLVSELRGRRPVAKDVASAAHRLNQRYGFYDTPIINQPDAQSAPGNTPVAPAATAAPTNETPRQRRIRELLEMRDR